ncbi:hypothetical protein ACP275_09G009900 [Erythranthe tilingii]
MKFIVLLMAICWVVVVGAASAFTYDEKELSDDDSALKMYERWSREYGVVRAEEEKEMRFSVFKETAAHVTRFNSRRPDHDHNQTYTMELSQFADWTPSEFRRRRCAIPRHELEERNDYDEMIMTTEAENVTSSYGNMNHLLPKEVNWVKRGAVTSVKSQIRCSCCWAFATIAGVEGMHFIRTRKLITLSTQELVDCESEDCDPYRVDFAFQFIKKNGITTDRIYPYIANYSGYCHLEKKNKPVVRIDGYYRVRRNDERALMIAVARQPVVALIEASPDFRHYSKGVFAGECGTELDHAVTIVGYGTTPCGIPYWLVKNSWGPEWGGEGGYIRMRRNVSDKRGLCGIAMEAYYPYKYKRS